MKDYNIRWEGQSIDSSQSMPLGGRDAGFNVWTMNDELCLYLSQSGTFDENGTMLKLGRLRIWCDDKTILSDHYVQELLLEEGMIRISAGSGDKRVQFTLWTDVSNSNLHVRFEGRIPHRLNLSYDCWRYRKREVTRDEIGQCRDLMSVFGEPPEEHVFTYPDETIKCKEGFFCCHVNRGDKLIYDRLVKQQSLDTVKEAFPNWLKDRIMGIYIPFEGLMYQGETDGELEGTDQKEYHFVTEEVCCMELVVSLQTGQYGNLREWMDILIRKNKQGISEKENKEWWNRYFNKSYVIIEEEHPGSEMWRVGRNYQLFRYMLGCNYYSEWPTKFNGGLFTFCEKFSPDYRNWSGIGFTAQNQRLVYWPMLRSGDVEGMRPQFDFYMNILEAGRVRASHYWEDDGACFSEQINAFGMSTGAEYNWHRDSIVPVGEDDNPWVRLHYSTALEFAYMMLCSMEYSGEENAGYLDFADAAVRFYFSHYRIDENGKLYIYPSSVQETYKSDPYAKRGEDYGAANPMDAVSGLRCVLRVLIEHSSGKKQDEYRTWLAQCPELPTGMKEGKECFMPADKYSPEPFNCEIPQLYRIYPFSNGDLTEEEISLGRNTYLDNTLTKDQRLLVSWHQNGIFAARLKMTDEAMRILRIKLGDSGKRFPAFWGPGHDWTPDHNWGGSGMIGLQEMLLQKKGQGYELLPAWDRTVNVRFKLWINSQKAVECTLKNGKLESREVMKEEE